MLTALLIALFIAATILLVYTNIQINTFSRKLDEVIKKIEDHMYL